MEKKTKTYTAEPDKPLTVNEPEMAYETTSSSKKTTSDADDYSDMPEGCITSEEIRKRFKEKINEYFLTHP